MQEKFIPGIYNYCDRWCERCNFTTRCRNFESTGKVTSEQTDINNKAFWDNLSSSFQNAIQLLYKAAEEHGIDLDNAMTTEEEEEYTARRSFLNSEAKNHSIAKLSKQYSKLIMPFVKENDGKMVNKVRELVSHLHLGIKSEEDIVHTMADLGDCIEIIQWYLFFIDAKLQRGLRGKMDGEEWAVDNGFPKDSDGSAKVAIIAIERSINAWAKFYELEPSSEDMALKALALLTQLKQKTIEEFPQAMQFKRPGFDD
ncbi:MAG: hypothetical protein ABUT20_62845 [Bacteroidota bacterium]